MTNVLVFLITGFFALILTPLEAVLHGFDWVEITCSIVLMWVTGMSITAGYHRLWSHKAYDASPVVRVLLAIGGAMALQNSILHWASDHRIHHRHVDDNDKDPYSAKRGFWYSHIGWMLREYQASRYSDYNNCRDLQKDKVVMWQHKHYLAIMLSANLGIPVLLGWLNGDIWGMFLIAGVFRLVVVHHITFFINSLAHIWGKQPYTDENTARDNGILAFFTFGEGYHNFHHIFEYDYRNGIRWWQFDPTKWLIGLLAKLGLAKNLRRVPEQRIAQAIVKMQLKRAHQRVSGHAHADEWLQLLQNEYELLSGKMTEYYQAKKALMLAKKDQLKTSYAGLDLYYEYKAIKSSLKLQQRKFMTLSQLLPKEMTTA